MREAIDKIHRTSSKKELLKRGFYSGIGWAIGATFGFVIISTILLFVLRNLGGVPLVGRFFASVVEATQEQLIRRTPFIPQ